MTQSASALILDTYSSINRTILSYLSKLSDEQLRWQSSAGSHAIAWHAWHLARWADHLQAAIPGMSPELTSRLAPGVQVWDAAGLAEQWGFDRAQLGFAETGMYMPDEVALTMRFPAKDVLLHYVSRVFELADRAIAAIDETQFAAPEQPQPMTEGIWGGGTVGEAILSHMTHSYRHLGMMEALVGVQGGRGTATR